MSSEKSLALSNSLERGSSLPHMEVGSSSEKNHRNNAATGASAAGVRALGTQLVSIYFRAPVKAFFRTRVDYMAFARAINPRVADGRWSLHTTTPGLLVHAARAHGWRFIQNQVIPPLLANAGIGAVLYTSYLQVLSVLNGPVSQGVKRIYPPISPSDTFTAGFIAGTVQSIVAAPLDALQARLTVNDLLEGRYQSMWHYGQQKLKQIGLRGVFAGWGLSLVRDSLGYYGSLRIHSIDKPKTPGSNTHEGPLIKPHYALEPCFLMLAGITASISQQVIQYPLSMIQDLHFGRLEYLDHQASLDLSRRRMLHHYYYAYKETYKRCKKRAHRTGGWRRWLFRGFFKSAVRQVPSTSAALVIFETVRRKYANSTDIVYIQKDGYNILLS